MNMRRPDAHPSRYHARALRQAKGRRYVTQPRPISPAADPVAAQRDYYRRTAAGYDAMRECEAEHANALGHIVRYLTRIDARTVLDTGCGTGRAMRFVARELPHLAVRGNDPSPDLLRVATHDHAIASFALDCASSESLPYRDAAFDAVIATGVMHHVPHPDAVVAEMLRVARKAVFISDSNFFGRGPVPARLLKLVLARARLLRPINRWRRGGHDWFVSEGDGVVWSYSVYDSLPKIAAACAETAVISTAPPGVTGSPLLRSTHCLLAGFKQALPP
jgi:ubiquinone/menaquinone biosynthesis C-methylase UbiE